MLILKIKDMSCGHCVSTVRKTVEALDPTADVEINLASKTARVASAVRDAAIIAALEQAGYPSVRVDENPALADG